MNSKSKSYVLTNTVYPLCFSYLMDIKIKYK